MNDQNERGRNESLPTATSEPLEKALSKWRRVPALQSLEDLLRSFSPAERALLYVFTILLGLSTLFVLGTLNRSVATQVPAGGGSLIEGIVGTPRFINPLLALSDADRDLAILLYSGLMRANPDGILLPDLAESYVISEDGLSYSFVIKKSATFHDGMPVTAQDVAFTVRLAQTPEVKSSKRADWEGVLVDIVDEQTVTFTLPRPYAPFLENATLGVLPQHLWKDVSPEEFPFHVLNTKPIGSGPYKIRDVATDSSGAPTQYDLRSFKNFALGAPHISSLSFNIYPNEDELLQALRAGVIESAGGITPISLESLSLVETPAIRTTLPRIFAVFFNQNHQPLFADNAVREALDVVLDKEAIIDEALRGYGAPLDGPIPPNVLVHQRSDTTPSIGTSTDRFIEAGAILARGGWERNEETGIWEDDDVTLSFTLTTADAPELVLTAQQVVAQWEALGADIALEVFATSDLNTNVIRPREYDALLFGEVVGRTLDLFAFWHSSQRTDPGLNLALYTNSKADELLSSARVETDRDERESLYLAFNEIIREDVPAIFLYAPDYIYIVPEKVRSMKLGALTTPAERFLNIHTWHIETESVWTMFIN